MLMHLREGKGRSRDAVPRAIIVPLHRQLQVRKRQPVPIIVVRVERVEARPQVVRRDDDALEMVARPEGGARPVRLIAPVQALAVMAEEAVWQVAGQAGEEELEVFCRLFVAAREERLGGADGEEVFLRFALVFGGAEGEQVFGAEDAEERAVAEGQAGAVYGGQVFWEQLEDLGRESQERRRWDGGALAGKEAVSGVHSSFLF